MLLEGRLRALLLLIGAVSAVPPPANVTVKCQNLKVTASWDYSKQQPQTIFRVTIKGSVDDYEIETVDHQYDLSHFIWKSEEHYMAAFYVTVTAIQGGNQSEAVPSNTLSFNFLKTVKTECVLDFPPVDLYVDESSITVSFQNPLHFYRELKQTIKPTSKPDVAPKFSFTVNPVGNGTTKSGEFEESCTAEQIICQLDVKFAESSPESCVTLEGTLFDSMGIRQVKFNKTGSICGTDLNDDVIVAIIVVSILIVIIIVAVILICKARAWTMKIPDIPKPLGPNQKDKALRYDTVPREDISAVSIDKPPKSPSVCSEDKFSDNLQENSGSTDHDPCDRAFYTERQLSESSNQELMSEGNRTDDCGETECISVESEEEETEAVSPYDCPHTHTLRQDMGNGDIVTAYCGK